jgi:uncharacterized 2Fe-2S/4Fe-4S cluster protein (DUF4445 family)
MHRVGIIDSSGRMNPSAPRVGQIHDGTLGYVLSKANEAGGREVVFTQADVRQIQLAKAAIRAGITILLDETDTALDEVDSLLLAGAFGNYIVPHSALRIGLLPSPSLMLTQIFSVGNAAGEGAKRLLLSKKARAHAAEVASRIEYIDLATNPRFQDVLLSHIPLPESAG